MKVIKTEQATIACMLIDENCRHEYGSLSEHDFTDEANRRIFTAIKTLTKQSKEVDYLTVYTLLNGTVPMTYIAELTGTLPNVRSFQQYVDRLKDLTLKKGTERPSRRNQKHRPIRARVSRKDKKKRYIN